MSPKKRKSRKPETHRQGLSGNPQRRAQQLRDRQERRARGQSTFGQLPEPRADPDRAVLRELAYRLAGGAPDAPWWPESHERILARARATTWPSRLVDLETQACQIVGDEFYDRLQSPGTGLHSPQWLRALAEETGAALRAELARGADNWQKLWALLSGLALVAPRTPAEAMSEADLRARETFPDIKDPHETALAEADLVARLLANRGLEPGPGHPVGGSRPAGEPLAARDAYGSRFLLMAPFSYDGGAPDHWYAWDFDLCWIAVVVGAGVFASAEDALSEWRDVVGPAASGAALSPCAAGMTARLLGPCLATGVLANMLQGRSLASSSLSTTGFGAAPATSPDPRRPAKAHPCSMQAILMMRSWAGMPRGTMTSPRQWPRLRALFSASGDRMRIWMSVRSTPARRTVSRWRRT